MESSLTGRDLVKAPKPRGRGKRFRNADETTVARNPNEIMKLVLAECREKRRKMDSGDGEDTSDAALSRMARFTDKFNLKVYEKFLHYVPRLVNVVTVSIRVARLLMHISAWPLCAARRGDSGNRFWHEFASGPPSHRCALPKFVLRSEAL